jgi:hypothetical protein
MSKKKVEQGTSEKLLERLPCRLALANETRLLCVPTCIQMKTVTIKTPHLGELDGLIQRILSLIPVRSE